MKILQLLLVLIVALFNSNLLFATVPIFQKLEYKEHLANKNVQDIIQDSNGYMWFGTSSGLFRYNGYDFEQQSLVGKSNFIINKLMVDSQGVLWALTRNNGLFKQVQEEWKAIDLYDKTSKQISANDMVEDNDGNFWLVINTELKYISSNNNSNLPIPAFIKGSDLQNISSIAFNENNLIVATSSKFSIINLKNNKKKQFILIV